MIAASPSGVVPVGATPRSLSLARMAGVRSALAIATESWSISGFGVPAVA